MKRTLLIMAAGLGSRYGGLKQIDPVGPNGEIIIDYSIYDALTAGFEKLVFVIRRYFEDAFREKIGNKFEGKAEIAYAYQELDACIDGFTVPANREKPWGTGHAILVARDVVNEPFAVINADDYYGNESFKVIAKYLASEEMEKANHYAMVGYVLSNTLSDYGYVSRGVCECNGNKMLRKVTERKKVGRKDGGVVYIDEKEKEHKLTGKEIASMNFWGFGPSIFGEIEKQFQDFLREKRNEPKAELYIPLVVDRLVESEQATVKVLETNDKWFGITYREDKPLAIESINKLIKQNIYPRELWAKK